MKNRKNKDDYYQHIGKTINSLKIFDVYKQYNQDKKRYYYHFICQCLKCNKSNIIKLCHNVLNNKTKTCGGTNCFPHPINGNKNKLWKGYGEISGGCFSRIRDAAKARKLDFNITIEYIWDLFLQQDRKCALTDIELCFSPNEKRITKTASLDRINPDKGYIEGNVQWVHKKINMMKHMCHNTEFIELCKKVTLKFDK